MFSLLKIMEGKDGQIQRQRDFIASRVGVDPVEDALSVQDIVDCIVTASQEWQDTLTYYAHVAAAWWWCSCACEYDDVCGH